MEFLLIYILKTTICLTLLYITYKSLLAKETFFTLNRTVLLLGIAASLCLPLVNINIDNAPPVVSQAMSRIEYIFVENDIATVDREFENIEISTTEYEIDTPIGTLETSPTISIENHAVKTDNSLNIPWLKLVILVYVLGVVLNIVALAISYFRMLRLIGNGEKRKYNNLTYCVVPDNIAPFSWGKYIVLSQNENKEIEAIVAHETAHIKHRHFLDILFSELVLSFHWFNPFPWKLKQALKDVHEFQADSDVIKSGINASQYQLLLLEKAVGASSYALANSFNHSKIKKRITMMLKQKSTSWSRAKLLFLIPTALVAVYAFSCTEASSKSKGNENLEKVEVVKLEDDSILRIYHPPVLDKDLRRVIGYGKRKDPLYNTMKMHVGWDYEAPKGTTIYAIKDGVVIENSITKGGYGVWLKIAHGNNVETLYAHNQENLVRVGDSVKTGQGIALVGNTGKSTGPHLHFETRKNGIPFNPIWLMDSNGVGVPIDSITDEYLEYRKLTQNKYKVCIDPGHGGKDPGKSIGDSIREKDINLSIAKKLQIKLLCNSKFSSIMTRSDDTFVRLDERSKITEQYDSNLFVSIHLGTTSQETSTASGIACYIPKTGQCVEESEKIANRIIGEFQQLDEIKIKDSPRAVNFAVLRDNAYPSILLELGYMNNPNDLQYITNPENQDKIVNALYEAILKSIPYSANGLVMD